MKFRKKDMRSLSLAVGFAVLALPMDQSSAQDAKADARAFAACKAASETFVQIASCIPAADVAVKTLDAFKAIYPKEAWPLEARCRDLNLDSIVGSASCVTEAVKAAVDLKSTLPEGATLDDPIFNAVSERSLLAKLEGAEAGARKLFPSVSFWRGEFYHPYK